MHQGDRRTRDTVDDVKLSDGSSGLAELVDPSPARDAGLEPDNVLAGRFTIVLLDGLQ